MGSNPLLASFGSRHPLPGGHVVLALYSLDLGGACFLASLNLPTPTAIRGLTPQTRIIGVGGHQLHVHRPGNDHQVGL